MHQTSTSKKLLNNERIAIHFPSPDDDFCFILGRVNYSKAQRPLEQHTHKGMMEIVLLVKGRQVYTVGGEDYTVNSGEVFVTFADEPHSTGHYPEDKSQLYYLIIDLQKLKDSFMGYDAQEGYCIAQALNSFKRRVFEVKSGLQAILDKVLVTYHSEYPFKKTVIRNLISHFLMDIIDCERTDTGHCRYSMQDVLNYIEKNIFEDMDIPTLANIAGLSVSRFKSSFRKQVGIPPREYVLRQKIESAKAIIKSSDMSITDIAFKLSFSSSQYFSTVFKRYTFMSPNEFKASTRTL